MVKEEESVELVQLYSEEVTVTVFLPALPLMGETVREGSREDTTQSPLVVKE